MENKIEVITTVKDLVQIVNDGKEGYKVAAEATADAFLKDLFLKQVALRTGYEQELKMYISSFGEIAENEKGGLLGIIHRTWLEIKDALNARDEAAILSAVKLGEQAALLRYDQYLGANEDDTELTALLFKQRAGILNALKAIEELYQQYTN